FGDGPYCPWYSVYAAFEPATVHVLASAVGGGEVFATPSRTAMSSLVGSAVVNTARCTMSARAMPRFSISPTALESAALAALVDGSGGVAPTSIETVGLWPMGVPSAAFTASVTTSA